MFWRKGNTQLLILKSQRVKKNYAMFKHTHKKKNHKRLTRNIWIQCTTVTCITFFKQHKKNSVFFVNRNVCFFFNKNINKQYSIIIFLLTPKYGKWKWGVGGNNNWRCNMKCFFLFFFQCKREKTCTKRNCFNDVITNEKS